MAEIRPNGTDKVRVFSIDINEYAEFGLKEEDAPPNNGHAIFSEYAAKSKNAEAWSKDSMQCLQATYPLAPDFPRQQHLRAALLSHSTTFSTATQSTNSNWRKSDSQPSITTAALIAASWTSSLRYSARKTTSCALTAARWNSNISHSKSTATNSYCSIRR